MSEGGYGENGSTGGEPTGGGYTQSANGWATYGSNVSDEVRNVVIRAAEGTMMPGNIIFQNSDGDEIMRIVPGPPARIIVADGVDVNEGAKAILSALEIAFGRRF